MGGLIWSFDNLDNFYFDVEYDIYKSSKIYGESDCKHDLKLLVILFLISVSYPTRSGCKE